MFTVILLPDTDQLVCSCLSSEWILKISIWLTALASPDVWQALQHEDQAVQCLVFHIHPELRQEQTSCWESSLRLNWSGLNRPQCLEECRCDSTHLPQPLDTIQCLVDVILKYTFPLATILHSRSIKKWVFSFFENFGKKNNKKTAKNEIFLLFFAKICRLINLETWF